MSVMIGPLNTERVLKMSRYFTSAFAIAALLGSFLIADTAEAAKARSTVERRHRANKGYFAPKTSTNRSYSSNRSMFRSTPRYTTPSYVAPRTYTPAPSYVPSSAPVVQQSYTLPSNVVTAPRVISSSPVVTSQPRVIYSSPGVTSQPQVISERVITPATPAANSSNVPHVGQGQPANVR
ncbi:hypothetical protein [Novipirellula caenicola]|uniref:Uncharacterized protein n=1 Tax=Novipirellula caenicola TaxID=1536901 RepID=A0ABP9VQ04_9BACT